MVKISALPSDTLPTGTDYLPTVDAETNQTKRVLLSDLASYLYGNNPYPTEGRFDFVASGGVWTGDSVGVNRNASMTAIVCYINGRRIAISAVTARTFTASKDTYIDILDNGDGTGTLVYTETTNNAASAALAANSIRIGIIVTGATTIATTGSVNQGEETKVLPIASSIAYTTTDSLGNLICPRDINRRTLGYRQINTSSVSVASATDTQVTGLSCPVIVPTTRRVKITLLGYDIQTSAAAVFTRYTIWDGTVSSGTRLGGSQVTNSAGSMQAPPTPFAVTTPTATSKTYNAGLQANTGTATLEVAAVSPAAILVELA